MTDQRQPTPARAPARIGIIISMFPELHETFILRELVALERRGLEFDIYSLQYPQDPITLDDARRLSRERTHYGALISRAALAALLRGLLRHPRTLCGCVLQVLWQGRDRPLEAMKNLAVLPLTLAFGETGQRRGVTHWHGHWANIPTTACWYLARMQRLSWSAAIHGEDIFTRNRFLRAKLDEACFSVVCSGYFCRHLRQQLGLSHPERVHLNYHGIDPAVLARQPEAPVVAEPASADSDVKPDQLARIVSIGRLVPTKGHDVLIQAMVMVRERVAQPVVLEIIGEGPERAALQAQITSLGLEDVVQLRGALAFADVLDVLCSAQVFALAPRMIPGRPPDGIPNVIAEAMALNVPVVSTRVSAIPELVEDRQTGRLVKVDDSQALAEAIAALLNDPAQCKALAAAGRQRVSVLFDQQRNIDELLALFAEHAAVEVTA